MNWWGKVLGGAFGFMLGGPLGALLGAVLGHNLDKGMGRLEHEDDDFIRPLPGDRERVQTAFFTATFSVMGHIAKADGRVTPQEIALAEAVMRHMDLQPEMRKTAIGLFNEGKQADFDLDGVLAQFRLECHRRRTLMRMFLEIQIQAGYADGSLHPDEERILRHCAQVLGISALEFGAIKAAIEAQLHQRGRVDGEPGPSLEDDYKLLNVNAKASDAELKKAYRRLINQHHPDKLVSKGLPEEMIKLATEKSQAIRAAYDRIRKARGGT
ncbi:MAG: co-chaperone DjlA [Chromatiales bacterium]|nr:co-chaperone DjlA [Chromatiales bacterium]